MRERAGRGAAAQVGGAERGLARLGARGEGSGPAGRWPRREGAGLLLLLLGCGEKERRERELAQGGKKGKRKGEGEGKIPGNFSDSRRIILRTKPNTGKTTNPIKLQTGIDSI